MLLSLCLQNIWNHICFIRNWRCNLQNLGKHVYLRINSLYNWLYCTVHWFWFKVVLVITESWGVPPVAGDSCPVSLFNRGIVAYLEIGQSYMKSKSARSSRGLVCMAEYHLLALAMAIRCHVPLYITHFYVICLYPPVYSPRYTIIMKSSWTAQAHKLIITIYSLYPRIHHQKNLRQDESKYRSPSSTKWSALPRPVCRKELLSCK